jgi:hypothetical protein
LTGSVKNLCQAGRGLCRCGYHHSPMISSKPAMAAMAGLVMWGATVLAQGTPPPQGPPPGGGRGGPPKNLQVLKDVPPDQLQLTMQYIAASLGVQCNYCHVQGQNDPRRQGDEEDRAPDDEDGRSAERDLLRRQAARQLRVVPQRPLEAGADLAARRRDDPGPGRGGCRGPRERRRRAWRWTGRRARRGSGWRTGRGARPGCGAAGAAGPDRDRRSDPREVRAGARRAGAAERQDAA